MAAAAGGGGNTAGPFNHAEHARGVRARHGETVDVAVVLVGRQLAYPGIADRVSDAPPVGTPPPAAAGAEMFLNLDAAGARGLQQAIDLDAPAFYGRKDAAELSSLADGTSLVGTVYVRLSATPAPHLMLIETRMVRGPPAAAAGAVHVGATARPRLRRPLPSRDERSSARVLVGLSLRDTGRASRLTRTDLCAETRPVRERSSHTDVGLHPVCVCPNGRVGLDEV